MNPPIAARQLSELSPRDPHSANSFSGRVFWITGLSGAGKTTIGAGLVDRLRQAGRPVVFLDGDNLRAAIAEDLGHQSADRLRSAMRNSRLCQLLSQQGVDVVCATISMFHDVQTWNRENIPGYFEIYLRVPIAEVERRDAKGIYGRARRREAHGIVGIDIVAEEPRSPELTIDNHGSIEPEAAVDLIWSRLADGRFPAHHSAPAVRFGTKAETLEQLAPRLKSAGILPQIRFSVKEWQGHHKRVLAQIEAEPWGGGPLVVRSSALREDTAKGSAAENTIPSSE